MHDCFRLIVFMAIVCAHLLFAVDASVAQSPFQAVRWQSAEISHGETSRESIADGRALVQAIAEPFPFDPYQVPDPAEVDQPDDFEWLTQVRVGYDGGFVVASQEPVDLGVEDTNFLIRLNGWGQLRHTVQDRNADGDVDLNQFQLKRGRLVFSGHAFNSDFTYFIQLDGRSSSGDDIRLLDYFMTYDIGRGYCGRDPDQLGIKIGKYKIAFSRARELSGRQFEFTDRSVASIFFDVNRSFAWGLYGMLMPQARIPVRWETSIFNGLVTGGAETGSSGTLDNNFAYSFRLSTFPCGEWGEGSLADFDWHQAPATRIGAGFASSTVERIGTTEFNSARVVDSGSRLADLLPASVDEYTVYLYSVDASAKWCGWSSTLEYYFRNISGFEPVPRPNLFDHGMWFQVGKFVRPRRLQWLARWSWVSGNSGTLGMGDRTSQELASGFVYYFRDQHAKYTFDATYLDGAPVNASALDIQPGDRGWLFRSQVQFAF